MSTILVVVFIRESFAVKNFDNRIAYEIDKETKDIDKLIKRFVA